MLRERMAGEAGPTVPTAAADLVRPSAGAARRSVPVGQLIAALAAAPPTADTADSIATVQPSAPAAIAAGARPTAAAGRRRAARADRSSVFRVPAAASPAPGSRAEQARRRATDAARRRPLLLSTPVIAAAIVVATSLGGERSGSADPSTGAAGSSAVDGTTLGQSDVRVSRKTRESVTDVTGTADATGTADTAGTASPTGATSTTSAASSTVSTASAASAEELALIDPLVAPPAEGGAPATAPTGVPAAPAPPPAATWVRPVEGGSVTSCFCTRWGTFHDGIDIDPPLGTPIVSVGDGTVVFAGPVSGYGIGIYIQHVDGSVSFYGHMAVYYVRTGDVVTTGQEIALVGNEGFSTGPHLHFSVFTSYSANGLRQNAIDPIPWLAERGVTFPGYN